ncbi:unnamed protein product [Heterobilharzia americana]|nr:unnamed protein product [Heterobilharzia americana]
MDLKSSLTEFLLSHVQNSSCLFDEEIITYLEGIIESCDCDEVDELEFLTMCDAYIPQLQKIPKEVFLEWFSSVSNIIKEKSNACGRDTQIHQDISILPSRSKEINNNSELKERSEVNLCKHCCTDCSQIDGDESLMTMASILPDACRKILTDCLRTTSNNVDEAVLLALNHITMKSHKNSTEVKESHSSKRTKMLTSSESIKTATTVDNDDKLDERERSLVLGRYDFVSESSSGRSAKPNIPSVYKWFELVI